VVEAIDYRLSPTPYRRHGTPVTEVVERLGEQIGECAGELMERVDGVDDYFFASTVVSAQLTDGSGYDRQFRGRIGSRARRSPSAIVYAYGCAGWGHVVRYVLRKAQDRPRRLLLQIVDVDIHGFECWLAVGSVRSGFAVTSLLLTVHAGNADPVLALGHAAPQHVAVKLGLSIRRMAEAWPRVAVCTPFLPAEIGKLFEKTFDTRQALDNWYDELGHCFGADPWIAIAREVASGKRRPRYIVASMASSGYTAVASVETVPAIACTSGWIA